MSLKRIRSDFDVDKAKFKIRHPGENRYSECTKEDIANALYGYFDDGFQYWQGGINYLVDGEDRYRPVDRRDMPLLYGLITGEMPACATEAPKETRQEDEERTQMADERRYMCRRPDEDEYSFIAEDDIKAIYAEQGEDALKDIHFRERKAKDKYEAVEYYEVMDALGLKRERHVDGGFGRGMKRIMGHERPRADVEFSSDPNEACACEAGCATACATEAPYEQDMCLMFCCREMMTAMLGGSGAVTISMDTGRLQVGQLDIRKCPFCGRAVHACAPPIEATEGTGE